MIADKPYCNRAAFALIISSSTELGTGDSAIIQALSKKSIGSRRFCRVACLFGLPTEALCIASGLSP